MASRMNRRAVLGGLATAAAMTTVPDLKARAASGDSDPFDLGSLMPSGDSFPDAAVVTPPTPGYHYDRFTAMSFLPTRDTTPYAKMMGALMHDALSTELFVCPFGPSHGTTLKELEFYIETDVGDAGVALVRNSTVGVVTDYMFKGVSEGAGIQVVTMAIDHVVDVIDGSYELWVTFTSDGTFWGARVGSIPPVAGLVSVAQNRKLDTRGGGKPALGSITTVDLAPDIPVGARAALVNLTATQTVDGGFVTAFPSTQVTPPTTSSLNWVASNTDIANTALVQLDGGTTIKLAVGGGATAAAHLLCDVLGYFT